MNLIAEGLGFLAERQIEYASRFMPYLFASYACHAFNLVNREKSIYLHFGRIPDCRLQILFTAPPGFSKSMFLKSCVKEKYGLLYNPSITLQAPYEPRPAFRFMGSCTEAGWTGSVDGSGANAVKATGQAEKYANGIIAMEEFTAITSIMKQEHSRHLEQMLNMSLFEGDVEKDLKNITISYHTDVSLMAGNQVMNFDISGGLFRRFMHLLWIPRLHEAQRLKNAVWRGDNIPLNVPRLMTYRAELVRLWDRLNRVEHVEFHPSLMGLMPNTAHHEDILYKNFALGYTIMSDSNVPREIEVKPNPELAIHMEQAIRWRHQLLADPQGFQTLSLIADLAPSGAWIPWDTVRERALIFSVGFEQTDATIRRLMGQRRLQYNGKTGEVRIA